MYFAALLCGIFAMMSLSSCGSDGDDKEDVVKANGLLYGVVLRIPSTDIDQVDLVKTVVIVKNSLTGDVLEETEVKFPSSESYYTLEQKISTLPFEGTVEVKQTLKEDVDLTKKEVYKTGLYIGVVICSIDKQNKTIAEQETHQSRSSSLPGTDLAKLYPRTSSFSFKVDESGNVKLH